MQNAFNYPGPVFIDRWAAGLFPHDSIYPYIVYVRNSAKQIWNHSVTSSDGIIHAYITHDLILGALN